jgi:Txe/YoeB family toxin of Txe-Axe toxin-antitoxin module
MIPTKVNTHIVVDIAEKEIDKISDKKLKRKIIRMINEIKEDMYKYLNSFRENMNKQLNELKRIQINY